METFTSGIIGGGGGYPESLDSSPRSRGGESWDEPYPSAPSVKLRLMCSYGGRIVPRPTDKTLCYLGGETRIVVVERLSTLVDLSARLSRSLLGGRSFTLKYQLPNEDLDSLISVATDEDLENMIDEYDRIAAAGSASARSSRLRLFLFPTKSESASSSIGSLLDDSKSENWFVDALNGAMGVDGLPQGFSSDSASVNCLLGLEDDSSVHSRATAAAAVTAVAPPESTGKLARDASSVPDSPMLDTNSSFGSTSSAPSISNLPPIRVRPDDRLLDQRIGVVEDQLAQMNLSAAAAGGGAAGQRQEEAVKETGYAQQPPPLSSIQPTSVQTHTISPTENPNRVFSSDDEKSDHGRSRMPPPLLPQQKPIPVDALSRPMYYQEKPSSAVAANSVSETGYRMAVPGPGAGYVVPQIQPEQFQQQQQQQQQFMHGNTHYIHQATGAVLPMPSYYPMPQQIQHHHQQFDQQVPMYYLPVRQNPTYNYSAQPQQQQQPHPSDSVPMVKPAMPAPTIPAKPELQPANLYRTAAAAPNPAAQPQLYPGMGYHVMQHQATNYGYEFPDPAHQPQPQVYYTQSTSPPALPPQYQTAPLSPDEVRQARAL